MGVAQRQFLGRTDRERTTEVEDRAEEGDILLRLEIEFHIPPEISVVKDRAAGEIGALQRDSAREMREFEGHPVGEPNFLETDLTGEQRVLEEPVLEHRPTVLLAERVDHPRESCRMHFGAAQVKIAARL